MTSPTPKLVIEFGDEEFRHSCGHCAREFGYSRQGEPFDKFAGLWERHAMSGACEAQS